MKFKRLISGVLAVTVAISSMALSAFSALAADTDNIELKFTQGNCTSDSGKMKYAVDGSWAPQKVMEADSLAYLKSGNAEIKTITGTVTVTGTVAEPFYMYINYADTLGYAYWGEGNSANKKTSEVSPLISEAGTYEMTLTLDEVANPTAVNYIGFDGSANSFRNNPDVVVHADSIVLNKTAAVESPVYTWTGEWERSKGLNDAGTADGITVESIGGGWQMAVKDIDMSGMTKPTLMATCTENKIQVWNGQGTSGTRISAGAESGTKLDLTEYKDSTVLTLSLTNSGKITSVTIYDAANEVEIDYTALDEAIKAGEAVATVKYTEDSVKVLTDAIAAAKAVKTDLAATQDDVDAAAKAITDAIDALVEAEKPDVILPDNGSWNMSSVTNNTQLKLMNYPSNKKISLLDGANDFYVTFEATGITTPCAAYVAISTTNGTNLNVWDPSDVSANTSGVTNSLVEITKDGTYTVAVHSETPLTAATDYNFVAVCFTTGLGSKTSYKVPNATLTKVTLTDPNAPIEPAEILPDSGEWTRRSITNSAKLEFSPYSSAGVPISALSGKNEFYATFTVTGVPEGGVRAYMPTVFISGPSHWNADDVVPFINIPKDGTYTVKFSGEAIPDTAKLQYLGINCKGLTNTSDVKVGSIELVKVTLTAPEIEDPKPTIDYTALDEAIASAEALDASAYTVASYAAVTTALGTAKTVKDNADATQDDVDAAAKAITDAIAALEAAPVIGENDEIIYFVTTELDDGTVSLAYAYPTDKANCTIIAKDGVLTIPETLNGKTVTKVGTLFNTAPEKPLTKIVLPATVTGITGNMASQVSATLEEIVLPEGLTTIASRSFQNLSNLKTITIPSTITAIPSQVFYGTGTEDTNIYIDAAITEAPAFWAFYDTKGTIHVRSDKTTYDLISAAANKATVVFEGGEESGSKVVVNGTKEFINQSNKFYLSLRTSGSDNNLITDDEWAKIKALAPNYTKFTFEVEVTGTVASPFTLVPRLDTTYTSDFDYWYIKPDSNRGGPFISKSGVTFDSFKISEPGTYKLEVILPDGTRTSELSNLVSIESLEYNTYTNNPDATVTFKSFTVEGTASVTPEIDYTALDEAIAAAEALDASAYTVDSYAAVTTALGVAKTTKENADATQDDVDAAAKALNDAIAALEEVPPAEVVKTYDVSVNGDGSVTATIYSDGTFRISGTGDTKDYGVDGNKALGPWYLDGSSYSVTKVVVDEGVTSIGSYLLSSLKNATTATIPSTVTRIGNGAFSQSGYKDIKISGTSNITSLEKYAFYNCQSLETVDDGFLSNVTEIPDNCFYDCTSLKPISIPDNITRIGDGAFHGCTALDTVTIPENVTYIGDNSFTNCPFTTIKIPDAVTYIGKMAFTVVDVTSKLESVEISDNSKLETIGDHAFQDTKITSINLPEGLKTIGEYAFSRCPITTLELPSTLTDIGRYAFMYCGKITGDVIVPEGITVLKDSVFSSCSNENLNLYIKGELTSVGKYSISYCGGKIYVYDQNTYDLINDSINNKTNYVQAEVILVKDEGPDYTALDEAIAAAEALDASAYTTASYAAVTTALGVAKTTKENADATQDDVDAAAKALNDAIAALEEAPVVPSDEVLPDSGEWTRRSVTNSAKLEFSPYSGSGVPISALSGKNEFYATFTVTGVPEGGVRAYMPTVFINGGSHWNADDVVPFIEVPTDGTYTVKFSGETIPDPAKLQYIGINCKGLTNTSDVKVGSIELVKVTLTDPNAAPSDELTITDFDGKFVDSTDFGYQSGGMLELQINTSRSTGEVKSILTDDQKAWITENADAITSITYEVEVAGTLDSPITLVTNSNGGEWNTNRYSTRGGYIINDWNCKTTSSQISEAGTYTVTVAIGRGYSSAELLNKAWYITTLESNSFTNNPNATLTLKSLKISTASEEIDYTALDKAIADAEALNASTYTASSFAKVTSALGTAKTTRDNTHASQETVDSAAKSLNDAIAALEIKPVLDYSKLEEAVKTAKEVDTSKYSSETAKALTDAIKAGEALLDSATATQAAVDEAAKAITDAQNNLVEKVTMTVYIQSGSSIKSAEVELNGEGEYSARIRLNNSYWYENLGGFMITPCPEEGANYTIDVDSMVITSNNQTYTLIPTSNNKGIVPTGDMTRTDTNGLPNRGFDTDTIYASSEDGTAVLKPYNSTTMRLLINGSMSNINYITYNFTVKEKVERVADWTEADKWYALAKDLLANHKDEYTEKGIADIERAISTYDRYNKPDLSQGMVDWLANLMKINIEGAEKPNTNTALKDLAETIKKAEAINTSEYTEETVAKLTEALEAAKAMNEDSAYEDVVKANNALKNAIEGLKSIPLDPFAYIYKKGATTTIANGKTDDEMAGATKIRVTFDCADDVSYNQYASIELKAVINGTESYQKFPGTNGYTTGAKGLTETLDLTNAVAAGQSFTLEGFTYAWDNAADYVYAVTKVEFIDADGNVLKTIKKPEEISLDELNKAIEKAEAIDTTLYTDETVKALTDAIAAAKKVTTASTEEEAQAAIDAINAAIEALELKPIVTTFKVAGKVLVSDEDASTEMTLVAEAADGTKVTATATSMGEYVLEGLAAGDYTLTISGGKYVERTYEITIAESDLAMNVNLNPLGDINGDGKVTTADVGMANSHAKGVKTLEGYAFACADANKDGSITTADVGMINSHAKAVKTLW